MKIGFLITNYKIKIILTLLLMPAVDHLDKQIFHFHYLFLENQPFSTIFPSILFFKITKPN